MLELVEKKGSPALLKVIGVGGGGSNAVNRMIQAGLADVDFWIANTDVQALERSPQMNRLQIGKTVTRGLGAGGDPEVGRQSAEEDIEAIKQTIEGADMVFITAGMGGGTGTGAAPVIARVARELNVLTVAIVTKPFQFEGKKKMKRAVSGLEALSEHVDTLIAIPNQKLLHIVEPGTSFDDALLMADEVLFQATRGISDLIMGHGIINLDFADVRTVMRNRGNALLGSGVATGPTRAVEAAQAAVSSPLLEEVSIEGAEALLVNIQGSTSMGFHEAAEAAQFIADRVGEDADVFWGAVVDPELEDELRVTLVATGFPSGRITSQSRSEAGQQAHQETPAQPQPPQEATAAAASPAPPATPAQPTTPAPPVDEPVLPATAEASPAGSPGPEPQQSAPTRPAAEPTPSEAPVVPAAASRGASATGSSERRQAPGSAVPGDRPGIKSPGGVPHRGNGGPAAAPSPPTTSPVSRPSSNGGNQASPNVESGGSRPAPAQAQQPSRPDKPQPSPPAPPAEPAPFWRQQSSPLSPKELGLPDSGPSPWSPGAENGPSERRGQNRNPLDVPTYLRKPIMD